MNLFQIIILILIVAMVLAGFVASLRGWASRREILVGLIVCLAGAVVTVWPDVTVRIARFLGIGRGADLVFYCAVVLMFIGFWMTYIRLRHLRRQMTLLVRRLAIRDAEQDLK